jgi:hypothetical protein
VWSLHLAAATVRVRVRVRARVRARTRTAWSMAQGNFCSCPGKLHVSFPLFSSGLLFPAVIRLPHVGHSISRFMVKDEW